MAEWWEGRKVRIPVPTRKIILQMYGENWRYPFPDFRWNLDPFLTGYCRSPYFLGQPVKQRK